MRQQLHVVSRYSVQVSCMELRAPLSPLGWVEAPGRAWVSCRKSCKTEGVCVRRPTPGVVRTAGKRTPSKQPRIHVTWNFRAQKAARHFFSAQLVSVCLK